MNYESNNLIRKSYIPGSKNLNNIFWAVVVTLGGLGFFFTGFSSFLNIKLLFFSRSAEITFIPQGITLLFYGTVGSLLGIFLWLSILWEIGSGYNEYNRSFQLVKLYRLGFPGKNREIILKFRFNEIKSIKMSVKEGLNPQRKLLLCLVDNREIPILGGNQPLALNKLEAEAISTAKFLNVVLESE